MTLLVRAGKKYRKIAKAEVNFYKKYFLSEKTGVDKWVHLELYQTQLEQMVHNTNIMKAVTNTGKIFMKARFLDAQIESQNGQVNNHKHPNLDNISVYSGTTVMTQILKNNLKNIPNTKERVAANKTEKFRSVTEHGNEFLRNLKNRKLVIEEDLYEDIEEEQEEGLIIF